LLSRAAFGCCSVEAEAQTSSDSNAKRIDVSLSGAAADQCNVMASRNTVQH